MRTLSFVFTLLLCSGTAFRAATVELVTDPKASTYFRVEGDFDLGDERKFFANAIALPESTLVLFNSDGGKILPALRIGKAIRLMGFKTLVLDGRRCVSACALAWLSGQPRFMEPGARIGFHAASKMDDGVRRESGAGNAQVGAYLNSLRLSDLAVYFVTKAPPHDMTWLTFADATRHGFEVRQFDLKAGAEPSPGLPPEPAPTSAPKADIANLLDVQEAAAIQERLRVLGYFSGVKDGLWGPRSRIALRDFKRHNQLPPNDAWDLDTQAALIRAEAVRAPAGYIPPEPEFTSEGIFWPFLPVPGTTYHPLNPDDAELLQEQLLIAGYYQSSPEGIWGMDSRNALRKFKAANGLTTDDIWDRATERALMRARKFSASPVPGALR